MIKTLQKMGHTTMTNKKPVLLSLLAAGIMISGFGFNNNDVQTYKLPKAKKAIEVAENSQKGASPAYATASEQEGMALNWDVPDGWQQDEKPGMMQLVSITVPASTTDGEEAKASIVELPGQAGGIVANVNRWRGQVGLPAQEEKEILAQVIPLDGREGAMTSFEITGEDKAIHIAIIEKPGRTAFIKLMGPAGTVLEQKDKFTTFAQSVGYGDNSE